MSLREFHVKPEINWKAVIHNYHVFCDNFLSRNPWAKDKKITYDFRTNRVSVRT